MYLQSLHLQKENPWKTQSKCYSKNKSAQILITIRQTFQKVWRNWVIKDLNNLKKGKLRSVTLLKKETLAQVFSCAFCEIAKKTFFTEHFRTTTSGFSIRLNNYAVE